MTSDMDEIAGQVLVEIWETKSKEFGDYQDAMTMLAEITGIPIEKIRERINFTCP